MHETIYESGAKRLHDQQARPRNNFKAKQADQVYAMSKAKMKNSSEQDIANWHLAEDLHSEFSLYHRCNGTRTLVYPCSVRSTRDEMRDKKRKKYFEGLL